MIEGHELHVRHRPRRHPDRHPRGGDEGGARRRRDPQRHARRRPLRRRRRRGRASRRSASCSPSSPNNLEDPPRRDPSDDPRPRGPGARHHRPGRAEPALRHARRRSAASSTTATSSRCTSTSRRTSSSASRGWTGARVGIVANQPAHLAGCLDINASRQGGALRPLLRRLQHPARDLRGRAGLPARDRPGVRRDHPPRRQAALRLRRGHGAEDHRHHAQGLRRRLLRHVRKHIRADINFAWPDRRDRGHGPGGRREHRLPARDRDGRRSRGDAPGEDRGVQREVREPVRGRRARLRRRRHRAARDAPPHRDRRSRCSATSATATRRRSTATSRCERAALPPDPRRQPRRDRGAHPARLPRDGHRRGRGLLRAPTAPRCTCASPTRRSRSARRPRARATCASTG